MACTATTAGFEVVLTRQSPLALREPGPDGPAVRTLLEAAMCAPDHGKLKPWRFIVIAGQARTAFGAVLADALKCREINASEARLAIERGKPLRAPLIIVVVAKLREHKLVPPVEQIISAGIAANNVLLVAHGLGYGGMWRTGAAAYDQRVREALGVADPDHIVAFLYLGTPDVMPPLRELAAFDPDLIYWQPQQSGGSDTAPGTSHDLEPGSTRQPGEQP